MRWESFISKLQYLSLFNAAPKAVLVHFGGNDFEHSTICHIHNMIRKGLSRLRSSFPGVKIVWVDILQRIKWRVNPEAMEHKRTRVNRCGRGLAHRKSDSVLTLDIDAKTPGFYRVDGVHMSLVGLEMYLDGFRNRIAELAQIIN